MYVCQNMLEVKGQLTTNWWLLSSETISASVSPDNIFSCTKSEYISKPMLVNHVPSSSQPLALKASALALHTGVHACGRINTDKNKLTWLVSEDLNCPWVQQNYDLSSQRPFLGLSWNSCDVEQFLESWRKPAWCHVLTYNQPAHPQQLVTTNRRMRLDPYLNLILQVPEFHYTQKKCQVPHIIIIISWFTFFTWVRYSSQP